MRSRLLRSSGDGVLDAEAVSLPRRASPVPPPPAAGGASIGQAVPILYQPLDRTDLESVIDTSSRHYRVVPYLNAFVPA